ncbi:MAG TPA: RNA polymerase sigma-70 factor [Vicinamibacterales bacterium]|nr:RNA polymerase sigma-70 factor [Vicinamibacterales bacterium]
MAAADWDEATFEAHRPLLFSIAYRMLGSASEAEDVIQDAWLRASQDAHADIRSPRAYLTTIVTRLCIDHLRSAERTRMEYPGPWLPEPLAEPNQESVELASSLTTAFLVLLEQLAPVERAVFLLREVFELDFDEIATSVGKSEANTRQILTRARGRLRDVHAHPRFTVSRRESEEIVRRFRTACVTGDVEELMGVLHADAALVADGGGKAAAATRPVLGADRIAKFMLGYARKVHWSESDFQVVTINGAPGLLLRHPISGDGTYSFDIADGRIRAIYVVRNPDKLRGFLERPH